MSPNMSPGGMTAASSPGVPDRPTSSASPAADSWVTENSEEVAEMAITFEEARALIAAAEGWDPASWGWDLLVDKKTGRYWRVSDDPPAPNLRPVGCGHRAR